MWIVKASTIRRFAQMHPQAEPALMAWLKVARAAEWQSIQDVRCTFTHADAAMVASGNTVTIFNIDGNKYRLVVSIKYRSQKVYIRDFLTHGEYDGQRWKERH